MEAQGRPSGTTRRAFVAAAGATAAGLAWTELLSEQADARTTPCAATTPGIRRSALALTRDGRTLWTADTGATTISAFRTRDLAHRHTIDVGDAPRSLALAPNGRTALVSTGFYDGPGLAIVDLVARRVARRADVGPAAGRLAFASDGNVAYLAAGTGDGRLLRLDPRTGAIEAAVAIGRDPRGLALTRDGRHALVALNGDAAVAVVDLASHRVTRRIITRPFPYAIVAAPRGDRVYASHAGFGDRTISVLDLGASRTVRTLAAGPDPAGLVFAGPHTLLVAERGAGRVALLDPRSGRRRGALTTGGFPRAVVVRGRRAYVLDEQSGRIAVGRV